MSDSYRKIALFILAVLISSCSAPATPSTSHELDLRHLNLSADDFSKRQDELLYAMFDTRTLWPSSDKMPEGFDPAKLLELGKDPGLGIRQLHEQGITGQGIAIAIIDQRLLTNHKEYKDQLRLYEETDDEKNTGELPTMHGAAVSSIAVGKTIGVAPDADLYYIGTGYCGGATDIEDFDFSCQAKAIQRIVEINKDLPTNDKIRVLSMSIGWDSQSKGYDEITAAVKEAKDAGIFVISSNLSQTYGLNFLGLGRNPLADPNEFQSYEPSQWWQEHFYSNGLLANTLLVPMDSRTTASEEGPAHYVFYHEGGLSWSIPYLAGMYALAIQVKPEITPEEFWATALQTGKTIQIRHNGKDYDFGVILNPQALISAIKVK